MTFFYVVMVLIGVAFTGSVIWIALQHPRGRGGYCPPSPKEWAMAHPRSPSPDPAPQLDPVLIAIQKMQEKFYKDIKIAIDKIEQRIVTERTHVRFDLPVPLRNIAEMLCERNFHESGVRWTVDELCRRLIAESLRIERDKSQGFGGDTFKECEHEWDYGPVMPHKYPEDATGIRTCRRCHRIDVMKFIPGKGFDVVDQKK